LTDSQNIAKWKEMKLKVFMQLGSWDKEARIDGRLFSRIFGLSNSISREVFLTSLVDHLEERKFDGFILSWYYPGCPWVS
jgi:GH18 family chitinase